MDWQPLSVSTVIYDGYPLEVALESLRRLGVNFVELAYIEGYSNDFDETLFRKSNADQVRQALDAAGISCRALSAHYDLSRPGGDDSLCRRLEFASHVGASMIATVSGPNSRASDFLANLSRAVRVAEELNVAIALENPADDTVATIGNGADAARVVAEFNHPFVRVNYDPGNLLTHSPGVPPQDDLLPTLPYCMGVHLKDLRTTADGYVHTAMGAGTIAWSEFFDVMASGKEPPLLSVEHPLRMRRDPRGRIILDETIMSLTEIEAILARSLAVVQEQIGRLDTSRNAVASAENSRTREGRP